MALLETVIEPYERTLNKMRSSERAAWAQSVLAGLRKRVDLDRDQIVFLAGLRYRELLLPHIQHYSVPMEGMSFGSRRRPNTRRQTMASSEWGKCKDCKWFQIEPGAS